MENNHNIDKKFSEASNNREPETFPGFDKVWDTIEKKLDQKKDKKRGIPAWIPYSIAASLIIGSAAFYLINKKDNQPAKPVIVQNTVSPYYNPDPKIAVIDSTVKSNIKSEISVEIKRKKNNPITEIQENNNSERINTHDLAFSTKTHHYSTDAYYIDNKQMADKPATYSSKKTDTTKTHALEEVVITGYAPVRKAMVASTAPGVTMVSSEKVSASASKRASSAEVAALSGKVAGLTVPSGSKREGGILIRGSAGLGYKSSDPLYIIDGIAVQRKEMLDLLDPKKIKELKVIKGSEAAAIYGIRGKNGALIVTTKGLSGSELKMLKKNSVKAEKEPVKEPEPELPKAGQLTAGEVNDFSKWNYWKDIAVPMLDQYKSSWQFFPDRRVSVQLMNKNRKPVIGEKIKLLNNKKEIIWETVSDNLGNAELWINPMIGREASAGKFYLTDHSGQVISSNIKEFKDGQNLIMMNRDCLTKRTLDIAFIVDATGSMGDEISYLQSELLDVLKKVETNLKNTRVRYGSVFYRDKGDEFVTRKFDFSDHAEDLVNFIKHQQARGGGDYPEAVVEAMQVSVDELKWSSENSTKIMFLILDAPPHQSDENIEKLYEKVRLAARKGITMIPLAASGIDKQTEYLMRTFALLTNGTYTFLTDDSGIGNGHIKPTADSYEVEKLNELFLRLILQRATLPECNDGISNDYLNKKLETDVNQQVNVKTTVFPNPTRGIITVKTRKKIDELFMYDITGKIIIRKENPDDNKSMDLTAYPQGIYLLRVRFGEIWETFKIIKN